MLSVTQSSETYPYVIRKILTLAINRVKMAASLTVTSDKRVDVFW